MERGAPDWLDAYMREPTDRYSDALLNVVRALLRGDPAAATTAMSAIAFESKHMPGGHRPSLRQLAEISERDHYQCRYCGIRTINSTVLALLSWAFPTELPVHPNWRADATHPVYLLQFATNDHVVPVARGRHPRDPDNLVTACWPCNAAKADLPLEVLRGWRLRTTSEADESWHGLADLHDALGRELGEPAVTGVAKQWLTLNQQRYGRPSPTRPGGGTPH